MQYCRIFLLFIYDSRNYFYIIYCFFQFVKDFKKINKIIYFKEVIMEDEILI
nr:MAG TPA: hypothetical protein [Caudoviricetes sp.]